MEHDLESNKENAIAFYRAAYLGDPSKPAGELYHCAQLESNLRPKIQP